MIKKQRYLWLLSTVVFFCSGWGVAAAWNLDQLADSEIAIVKTVLTKLEPGIKAREAQASLATLTFAELYEPLTEDERVFVKSFQTFEPLKAGLNTTWHGIATGREKLHVVHGQRIRMSGKPFEIPAQYAPPRVARAYKRMMRAMQKDLGHRLYIESGYRSSAYQLYLFLAYLKNHGYSVRETAHWNAFPGYSEHGDPKHQALDFINEDGISGETNPEEFAALAEYRWLLDHAHDFGFVLSFPKKDPKGVGFEPWHWRYEGKAERQEKTRQK